MAYGTPEQSEEYDPEENKRRKERYREPLNRRTPKYEQYSPKETNRQKAGRIITGLKSIGEGTIREARGFAKEIKTESIRSGLKTQRTMQRPLRRYQRTGSATRRGREPRTRIRQYRPVMPPSAGLGERAVIEASQGYVPVLDRQFFPDEEKDLIGVGGRDMNLLVSSVESNFKKKEQKYY
jgi:hypothetical protein